MPPTTFNLFCSTAALRIGVADFSFATLSITFCRMAFLSVSSPFGNTALTAGAMAVTRDGICPGSGLSSFSDFIVASNTAFVVTERQNERCPKDCHGIFQTGDHLIARKIAGHTAHE